MVYRGLACTRLLYSHPDLWMTFQIVGACSQDDGGEKTMLASLGGGRVDLFAISHAHATRRDPAGRQRACSEPRYSQSSIIGRVTPLFCPLVVQSYQPKTPIL